MNTETIKPGMNLINVLPSGATLAGLVKALT